MSKFTTLVIARVDIGLLTSLSTASVVYWINDSLVSSLFEVLVVARINHGLVLSFPKESPIKVLNFNPILLLFFGRLDFDTSLKESIIRLLSLLLFLLGSV